jgi:hypothetical protein
MAQQSKTMEDVQHQLQMILEYDLYFHFVMQTQIVSPEIQNSSEKSEQYLKEV